MAFPYFRRAKFKEKHRHLHDKITPRDLFAAAAFVSLTVTKIETDVMRAISWAFELADEMLSKRKEPEDE